MGRGLLGKKALANLTKELPDVRQLHRLVLALAPDFISIKFPPESSIPVAAVCLRDATEALLDARYALHEAFAHRVWYLEKRDVPSEGAAAYYGRFYADGTALRLYAAGEHLANAIICMLEITDQELEAHRKKGRISQQVVVLYYLKNEKPTHPVTQAVLRLAKSKEWKEARRYRDIWVHEQPPLVAGRGIVYERRKRWVSTDRGQDLSGGGGDVPRYSVKDLIGFVQPATFVFAEVLTDIVRLYIELLRTHGVNLNENDHQLSVQLF